MKRILTILSASILLLGLLLPLAACTEDKKRNKNDDDETEETSAATSAETSTETSEGTGSDGSVDIPENALVFDGKSTLKPGKPEEELDPEEIYEILSYTPQMFYGNYRILGGEDAENDYAEDMSYVEYQCYNYKNESTVATITSIPYKIEAGPHSLGHIITKVKGRNFLRAYFYNDSGYMTTVLCAYTVKDNELSLNPLAFYKYDQENSRVSYILSETILTYEFKFEGRKLTLDDGENSLTLHSGLNISDDDNYIAVDNYRSTKSDELNKIDHIRLLFSEDDDSSRYVYAEEKEFGNDQHPYAVMEENGLFTITMDEDGETVTRQFVYFYCYKDGIILTDGENIYYYCDRYSDRYGSQLNDNLTYEDMEKLDNMDDEKLEELIKIKEELLEDLEDAFEDADISVSIDSETGEITMDAAVLFPVGEYTVSQDGKDLLKKFIEVYSGVVFDEKYNGFISKIMVEGHTDSTGDYASNQTLSQNRADSVKALCLDYGEDCREQLNEMLQAVGYSSDKPIFNAFGEEDKAASRRVCFRFIINLD